MLSRTSPADVIRADVIREVLSRTCHRSIADAHTLKTDLQLNCSDRAELLAALELALRFEMRDFVIDGELTVGDLVAILGSRANAA